MLFASCLMKTLVDLARLVLLYKPMKKAESTKQTEGGRMKMSEFQVLCGKYLITPELALENDTIRAALLARDDDKVETALKYEVVYP